MAGTAYLCRSRAYIFLLMSREEVGSAGFVGTSAQIDYILLSMKAHSRLSATY